MINDMAETITISLRYDAGETDLTLTAYLPDGTVHANAVTLTPRLTDEPTPQPVPYQYTASIPDRPAGVDLSLEVKRATETRYLGTLEAGEVIEGEGRAARTAAETAATEAAGSLKAATAYRFAINQSSTPAPANGDAEVSFTEVTP